MLAYAAHRRTRRQLSPPTLIAIVAVHAAALTALALAKMDGGRLVDVVTTVYRVRPEPIPPDPKPQPKPKPAQQSIKQVPPDSHVDRPQPVIPNNAQPQPFDPGPRLADPGPLIGTGANPLPPIVPDPPKVIVARPTAPVLATPADQLRPPYPEEKRRLEEEAVLRLRLAIDPRGRVTEVDPVGAADPLFLASARSHLLRYWRYRPATEAGQPVATSIVVTLRFRLDEG
ncbi:energy transducer TonB [Sphingomonas sp. KRR8]|uniref:energy transducer TonB n=1 Tax=Sphingomonas sp. KRR8 TaxID=2942996 RepID=UPI00202159E7|nr:energy transducer TonB [Sphingomonas sp. KRR8]URD60169.1 energy transducer TonB [Sphingomonas sp. KRR8]